jgi:hypothetical protein
MDWKQHVRGGKESGMTLHFVLDNQEGKKMYEMYTGGVWRKIFELVGCDEFEMSRWQCDVQHCTNLRRED